MQIVKYEINNNILVVGFKESNFVVYSQITYDSTKTKYELLQKAYIQCKNSIEYEKTQIEHSFITEEKGEFFVPESLKAKTIKLTSDKSVVQFIKNQTEDSVNLNIEVKDQYNNNYVKTVRFTTNYGVITNNVLTIPSVSIKKEITITASIEGVTDTINISVFPCVTENLQVARETKIKGMSDKCEYQIVNTFHSNCLGENRLFDCDRDSQLCIQGLVAKATLLASNVPMVDTSLDWKATDEPICYTWTIAQVLTLGGDLYTHLTSCKKRYENLRIYIKSLTTTEEIDSVTWETIIPN